MLNKIHSFIEATTEKEKTLANVFKKLQLFFCRNNIVFLKKHIMGLAEHKATIMLFIYNNMLYSFVIVEVQNNILPSSIQRVRDNNTTDCKILQIINILGE